jgi:hypothetical protein
VPSRAVVDGGEENFFAEDAVYIIFSAASHREAAEFFMTLLLKKA